MDLSGLSLSELQELRTRIDNELYGRTKARRREALKELHAVAEQAGFSLDELVGKASAAKTRKPAVVKYRDPKNPNNTWAGRGRKPKWLEAAEKGGAKLSDFAV